jgi:hypothetical protein
MSTIIEDITEADTANDIEVVKAMSLRAIAKILYLKYVK